MRAKLLIVLLWVAMATEAIAASARSQNFAVNAQSQEMAQRIARDAEGHRQRIALALLGRELPTWRAPCAVTVSEGGSSSGVTSFNFANAADSIDMTVRGPREQILRDTLPHEVGHSVLLSVFRRPLPRWLDEGFCVCQESATHRTNQIGYLNQSRQNRHTYPLRSLVSLYEYPGGGRDGNKVMALYAQGHCYVSFLLAHGGERRFLQFVSAGVECERTGGKGNPACWERAFQAVYGCGIEGIEQRCEAWSVGGQLARVCRCGPTIEPLPVQPTAPEIDIEEPIAPTQPIAYPDDGYGEIIQLPATRDVGAIPFDISGRIYLRAVRREPERPRIRIEIGDPAPRPRFIELPAPAPVRERIRVDVNQRPTLAEVIAQRRPLDPCKGPVRFIAAPLTYPLRTIGADLRRNLERYPPGVGVRIERPATVIPSYRGGVLANAGDCKS